MDEALREQQLRYDEGWRRGLAAGKEQRGNLQAHLNFINHCGLLQPASRILEVGCGIGTVVADLHRRGFDATGVDISREAIHYGRNKHSGARLAVHTAEDLPFSSRSFNLVLSFDVMEHLMHVDGHLNEVSRVLEPDGHYVLQTPAKCYAVVAETMSHRSLRWRVNHPSLQTPRALKRRLIQHGFAPRFVKVNPIDDYAQAKLRLPRWLLRVAGRLPWHRLPLFLHPNLFVVAQRCAS